MKINQNRLITIIKHYFRDTNYDIDPIKSLIWTLRSKGILLLSRHSKLMIHHDNLQLAPNSTFQVGVGFFCPTNYTSIRCSEFGKIIINGYVRLLKGGHIIVSKKGVLEIGDRSYLNEQSRIQCQDHIKIGSRCAIAWGCQILDTDEHTIMNDGIPAQKYTEPVSIGDHVWIGCQSIILKGVHIGDNSIIGAGSIVTKDIPPNALAVGNPAKVIREGVNWN